MPRPALFCVDSLETNAFPPGAVPLVLLHAFPFHHGMWHRQWDVFHDKRRAIACDLTGFGQSAGPGDGLFMMDHMAEDLAHLLDHLGVHQAALAGLSMGGYVALRFAERWPQRVRGLALCDTRSEADGNSARAARAATMNLVAEQGMEAFLETFLPTVFAPETWTDQPGVIDEARRILRSHSPTTVRRGLMAITSRSDTTEALGTFPFPVTCIVGEKDTLTPPALSEAMARRAPRGRLEIIPTAGHMSCLENPQAFNEALARWLDEVDASEPPLPS